MEPKTLKALKASIAKWEKNAEAETPAEFKVLREDCALCSLFNTDHHHMVPKACVGCPVFEHTGRRYCTGTPYIAAANAFRDWSISPSLYGQKARATAEEEVKFLKSLLPFEAAS